MNKDANNLEVDLELIRRLDKNGPRYTSYPTADRFVEAFNAESYRSWVEKREIGGIARPLSFYIHIPFCKQACHYCDFHFSTSLQNKDAFLNALSKNGSVLSRTL